ncbi:MAG TPA: DUF4185 domain-containing protein [Candidatus Binataceae bacterium]
MRIFRLIALAVLFPGYCASILAADCVPSFPYTDGWLGGDAAYSVPIGEGRDVWLFGDTFVGRADQKTRSGATIVSNTVAVTSCEAGHPKVHYYWNDAGKPVAKPFFDSKTSEFRYWPLDGFYYRGALYVCLIQIAEKRGDGQFGFHGAAVALAKVSGTAKDPDQWEIEYRKLFSGDVSFPGVSAVVSGDYAYLYAAIDDSTRKLHPIILTRIPLAGLDRPSEQIEYLANSRTWKKGIVWQDARIIIKRGAAEMSVRYHPALNKWIAVQANTPPSRELVLRSAPALEGPWSEPQAVYSFPEMTPGQRQYDKDTFCYAGKEHLELSPSQASYVCNSFEFRKQVENLDIYRPMIVPLGIR